MAKLTDVMGRPSSGTVPFAVIGLVEENVDPDGLGRIKVKFPTLHQEPTSFWLRQVSPNAGKERGLYALPEIEDEVMVVFMQGSQDVGVIVGQFWNGKDIPPKECKDGAKGKNHKSKFGNDATHGTGTVDDNDRRFWKSRSGHLLIFDDKDGKETVELWDKSRTLSVVFDTANELVQISSANGCVSITAGKDITLTAGKNIKVDAGKNWEAKTGSDTKWDIGKNYDLKAAMNAKMKAGQNFKMEAGVNFDAKAGVNMKLKGGVGFEAKGGATAKLQGGAMAVVKGGLVMIN